MRPKIVYDPEGRAYVDVNASAMRVPRFPGTIVDPRETVRLRAGLIQLAEPGNVWEASEHQQALRAAFGGRDGFTDAAKSVRLDLDAEKRPMESFTTGFSPDELRENLELALARAQVAMRWYRTELPQAKLIYISPELVDIIEASAPTIPDDYVLEEHHAPVPTALVVLGRPLLGIDAQNTVYGRDGMRYDAILWGNTFLKGDHEPDEAHKHCISSASFRCLEPSHTDLYAIDTYSDTPEQLRIPMWLPLGRSDWPIGFPVSRHTFDGLEGVQWESMKEDRKVLAALWALINQKRVVEQTVVSPNRAMRRQAERGGYEAPDITVVHLRDTDYRPSMAAGERSEGRYGCRWVVSPHWRNQAHGPGRTLRKLILVPPHIKGPVDAPLRHTERIWAVDR